MPCQKYQGPAIVVKIYVTRIIKKTFIGILGKVVSFMIVPGNSTDSQ